MTYTKRHTGSRGVKGTWLEQFFGNDSNFSRDYFIAGLSCSESKYRRFRNNDEPLDHDSELFKRLIELVKRDGIPAKQSLSSKMIGDQLYRAKSDFLREKGHEKTRRGPVDPRLIKQALEACESESLQQLIVSWCDNARAKDLTELTTLVAEHMQAGALSEIRNIFDKPMMEVLSDGRLGSGSRINLQQIKKLESLIGAIAVSFAVPCQIDPKEPSIGIKVFDVKEDWSIRLVIDAALGLPLTHVYPTNHSPKVHKDYAGELEGAESTNVEAQARQILEQLNNPKVSEDDALMPELDSDDYEQQMWLYCEKYNNAVFYAYNPGEDHRFLYGTGEFADDVRDRLHTLGLADARIVETVQNKDSSPSLRVAQGHLSGWLTLCLTKIKQAVDRLPPDEQGSDPSGNTIIIYASEIGAVGDGNKIC